MSLNDPKLKTVIRWIAHNPGKNLYQLPKDLKDMNRTTAMRKIQSQYKLIENGFLSMEKGKRNADRLRLTFKGLLLSLDIEAISPEEAATVRQNSSIEEPYSLDPMMKEFFEYHDPFDKFAREQAAKYGRKIGGMDEGLFRLGQLERMDQFIERKFSQSIYSELRKKVNVKVYDEEYTKFVFQTKYRECVHEFWRLLFDEGDVDLFRQFCKEVKKPAPPKEDVEYFVRWYSKYIKYLHRLREEKPSSEPC